MSADPLKMVRVQLRAGSWRGDPRQLKEKIRSATARAFQKSRLEMVNWITKYVPEDTGTLMASGIGTLFETAHQLYFPFELWLGFPAETTYTYKTGERKGQTKRIEYAEFVDQMRERGAKPRKGTAIAPFIDPAREALRQKVLRHLKKELGEDFPLVNIEIYD